MSESKIRDDAAQASKMKDVATQAGVSISTVSHVINNTRFVSEKTRTRVREAMRRLNYHPNALARSLRNKMTNTIGIIITDIENDYFTKLVRGCEDYAYQKGFNTILCNSDEDPIKEELYINVLLEKQIDGLIISPTCKNIGIIEKMLELNKHVVFVDRYVPGLDIDYVVAENVEAGRIAARHLAQVGHRSVSMVISREYLTSMEHRRRGFIEGMTESGLLSGEDALIRVSDFINPEAIQREILEELRRRPKPDCILCANSSITLGVIGAIKEMGLCCPHDIGVMGIGDYYWTGYLSPKITSVYLPSYDIGVQSTRLIISKIRNKKGVNAPIVLPVHLNVGESCGYGLDGRRS